MTDQRFKEIKIEIEKLANELNAAWGKKLNKRPNETCWPVRRVSEAVQQCEEMEQIFID